MLVKSLLCFVIMALLVTPCLSQSQGGLDIAKELQLVSPLVIDTYKTIHSYPELGKHEFKTAQLIRSRLREFGYVDFIPVPNLDTAVIAVLDTGRPGKVVALRAELDGRPGTEETKLPYASKVPNVMHSCGHDAHAAILLGAAKALYDLRVSITGKIVFVFQPAEETAGGADDIVASNVLDKLGVEYLYALHSAPTVPVGSVQISPGSILAGSNYFTVTLNGKSSHAASPQEGSDLITVAAEAVTSLTKIPARSMDVVGRPALMSVTYFQAGDEKVLNILPSTASFKGTIRSFEDIDMAEDTSQLSIHALMKQRLDGIAAAYNIKIDLEIRKGSPPTINNRVAFDKVFIPLRRLDSNLSYIDFPRFMFSEDFAFYTPKHSCLYLGLGVAKDGMGGEPVHTSRFSVSLDALTVGVRLMVRLIEVTNEI